MMWLLAQDGIGELLAESDIGNEQSDDAGNPLDVVTLLRRSYIQLPSDEHRCTHTVVHE